ncbi:MAG TPA: acyltransferase [Chthoniobacterales bacterium]|nr:acyltransferase [Chthoniobacterales bacterium]
MSARADPIAARSQADRVFGLDLLRAAAIMSVICAHGFVVLYPYTGSALGVFGHGGFYGVELFFVLSGFLIGQILIRQGAALGQAANVAVFYIRRWFRTLPLFFLFLGINVWLEIQFREHRLGWSEILSHGFFLRNLTGFHMSFFPESWSLAVEEWFYLLFPAALWLGLKISKRFDGVFLSAAFAFFIFSTVARMFAANDPAATWAEAQRMVVIYRFDALMLGILAAWISVRFPERWRKRQLLCALAGGALLLAMYATLWKIEHGRLAFGDDSYFARTFRFTFVSLGFGLLLPWASGWKLARKNVWSTAVRRIALWSYGLYLVHLPVSLIVTRTVFRDWERSIFQAISSFTLQIGGAVVLSALLYRFFESPCTRLREKAAPVVAGLFPRH